jgi:deoxycytidylate deaminase
MDRNIHYINIAKEVAKLSNYPKYHLGCIAVYNNTIISSGYNSNKSHPLQDRLSQKYHPDYNNPQFVSKLHAEISCLSKIYKNKKIKWCKVKLYIARINDSENHDDKTLLAKPCIVCMNFIKNIGIKEVYYTTNDDNIPYKKEKIS